MSKVGLIIGTSNDIHLILLWGDEKLENSYLPAQPFENVDKFATSIDKVRATSF